MVGLWPGPRLPALPQHPPPHPAPTPCPDFWEPGGWQKTVAAPPRGAQLFPLAPHFSHLNPFTVFLSVNPGPTAVWEGAPLDGVGLRFIYCCLSSGLSGTGAGRSSWVKWGHSSSPFLSPLPPAPSPTQPHWSHIPFPPQHPKTSPLLRPALRCCQEELLQTGRGHRSGKVESSGSALPPSLSVVVPFF